MLELILWFMFGNWALLFASERAEKLGKSSIGDRLDKIDAGTFVRIWAYIFGALTWPFGVYLALFSKD